MYASFSFKVLQFHLNRKWLMAITIGLLHIFVGLFVVILASDLDLEYVTNCYMRTYKYQASKPFKLRNGIVLTCWDIIPVYSCWGRCDSSEVRDLWFNHLKGQVCTTTVYFWRVFSEQFWTGDVEKIIFWE